MWIYLGLENYLLKLERGENNIVIYVTNLINIWKAEYTLHELIRKFKELNPIFDMADKIVIDKVLELYGKSGNKGKHQVESSSESISLTSTGAVSSYTYKMELLLQAAQQDMLYHEFTTPILLLLKELHEREQRLVQIVQAKDTEIEEYKLEGVEIKRRGVVTEPFCYESFQRSLQECGAKGDVVNPASLLEGQLQEMLERQADRTQPNKKAEEIKMEPTRKKKVTTTAKQVPSVPGSAGCLYKAPDSTVPTGGSPKKKVLKITQIKL